MLKHLILGVELPFDEKLFAAELATLQPLLGLEKLTLVHVKPLDQIALDETLNHELQGYAQRLQDTLHLKEVDYSLESGMPTEALNQLAGKTAADGIAILFHNHSKTYEFFLGSVALDMARTTAYPLLLLTGQPDATTTGTLMLASDASKAVEAAEEIFVELSQQASQAVVINVETDKDQDTDHQAILDLQSKYASSDKIEMVRAQGDPVNEILQSTRYHGVDLLVLGKRGQNPLQQLLFGSTAEQLCRQIKRPVLVIPPR